jgi:hypothetical protein
VYATHGLLSVSAMAMAVTYFCVCSVLRTFFVACGLSRIRLGAAGNERGSGGASRSHGSYSDGGITHAAVVWYVLKHGGLG